MRVGTSLIDFTKVARRPRTFLHPKISVDKAQKIVLSNSTFLNSEKKHYKGENGVFLAGVARLFFVSLLQYMASSAHA